MVAEKLSFPRIQFRLQKSFQPSYSRSDESVVVCGNFMRLNFSWLQFDTRLLKFAHGCSNFRPGIIHFHPSLSWYESTNFLSFVSIYLKIDTIFGWCNSASIKFKSARKIENLMQKLVVFYLIKICFDLIRFAPRIIIFPLQYLSDDPGRSQRSQEISDQAKKFGLSNNRSLRIRNCYATWIER